MMEFATYVELREAGATAVEVYRAGKASGLSDVDAIRMLRSVFGMSLRQAKETFIVASGAASSLKEHEERLAGELSRSDYLWK